MHTSSLSLLPSSVERASDPALKHLVRTAVRKYAELCGFGGLAHKTSTKAEKVVNELLELFEQIGRAKGEVITFLNVLPGMSLTYISLVADRA